MVKNILVALDGSEHSKKAVEFAINSAKMWKAALYLIHVWEEKSPPEGFEKYVKEQKLPLNYFDEVCMRDKFVGAAEVRAKEVGIKKVEVVCAHGDPAEEILRVADQVTADLIIMGSRGLGRFSRVIMGSVSTKVCNHSNSTCVIVR